MSCRDSAAPPPAREAQLRFDRYILAVDRGSLLVDGNEIALRPKTFAVLRYLVENSGRLISKDELFAAVWPNLAVTDDTLVQSVGELRRALADDGARLIRTVPRRGYRFDAAVFHVAPGACNEGAPSVAHSTWRTNVTGFRAWRYAASVVLVGAAMIGAGIIYDLPFFSSLPVGDQPLKRFAVETRPTIAVLPFVNQSDNSAREYFVDGLTQEIITALGRFSALTVMSWNAVLPYKGRPATPKEVGSALAVRYQVEGSVRHTGERVRVNVQLVDTEWPRCLVLELRRGAC